MNKYFRQWLIALGITSLCAPLAFAEEAASAKTVSVYTTAKDTNKRLSLSDTLTLKPSQQPPETDVAIFVNPEKRYQTLLGIGGAITDSSAEVFATLSKTKKEEFLKIVR